MMEPLQDELFRQIETLKWLRMGGILISFVTGIGLVYAGWPRVAIMGVGAGIMLCGAGYAWGRKAAVRAASLRTGGSVAELTEAVRAAERRRRT